MLNYLILAWIFAIGVSSYPYERGSEHQGPPGNQQIASVSNDAHNTYTDPQQATAQTAVQPPERVETVKWTERWLVILAFPTLFVIGWQAWETRKSAQAALAQMRATINRDRAVIKIQPQGMAVVDDFGRNYWFLQSEIGVRNVGINRAYILNGNAKLKLRFDREKPKSSDVAGENLRIVEGFIPADTPPDAPHLQQIFYAVHELSVAQQADYIFPGKVVPYIAGFVEYETVGTTFRRNFHYSWKSRGSNGEEGFQAYRILHSLYFNTPPSNQERICAGEWFKEAEGNEEYEVKPPSPPGLWSKIKAFVEEDLDVQQYPN